MGRVEAGKDLLSEKVETKVLIPEPKPNPVMQNRAQSSYTKADPSEY